MNDRDTGRDIRAFLAETAPFRGPADLLDHVFLSTSRKRQRPSWLALMKEPPMRLSSRLAVGSPMARLTAIAAATLLLALMATGAVIGAATLLAGPALIVVAQDGSGDHMTIAAGVAAAKDGDTVLVRPGTYVEAVVIERDITLTGDGPREEVVITAPEDGPTAPIYRALVNPTDPYAILLLDSEATLSNLTFRSEASEVHASGGAPTLTDLAFESVGVAYRGGSAPDGSSVVINGGSAATVTANTLTAGGPIGVFDGSPLIEGNTLTGGPHIWGGFGDGTVIRGNTINGAHVRALGIFDEAILTIEGNTIMGSPTGIAIWSGSPRVTGNTISGSTLAAVEVLRPAEEPVISDNQLIDNAMALNLSAAGGLIEGNDVRGGAVGIVIGSGAPTVQGNTIEGASGRGLVVAPGAAPTLIGNTSCRNGENLFLAQGVDLVVEDSNEICADAPAG